MSEIADRLLEKRANIGLEMTALLTHAESENRDLDATEQVSYAKMNDDLDSLRARADRLNADEKATAETEEAMRSLSARRVTGPTADADDSELRKFMRGESRSFVAAPTTAEMRDLTSITTASGGATVPKSFYGELYQHMIQNAALLQFATVIRTTGGEPLEFPVTTAHSSAALTAENTAISESDPVFATRTLNGYQYATLIQAPRQLVDDTGVDLEGYLSAQAGRAVGNALGAHLVAGSGSSQPTGLMTSTTLGVTGANAAVGAFTADNLIDLYYSVISSYRNSPSAAWLMRDQTLATVRKLKGSDNNYLWVPGLAGAPDTILGTPVATDPNVAAVGLGARSVAFGDMSAYYVRLAGGIRFERSDEFAFNTDQVTFRCLVRGDGVLLDQTGAVKHFIGGAS
jgi:HK97 family phage major capsid protein